jgi:hypothetical protein
MSCFDRSLSPKHVRVLDEATRVPLGLSTRISGNPLAFAIFVEV